MASTRVNIATTALLAAAALAVAGCGSGSGNPPSPGASAGHSPQDGAQAAYRYSACMRNHGVTNFPDPKVSRRNGGVAVAIAVSPAETGSPRFNTAQKACQGILPGPQNPAQQAAQQHAHMEDLLSFAQCMRAHGVSGFPDPNARGDSQVGSRGVTV